jgi:hypothetical protein
MPQALHCPECREPARHRPPRRWNADAGPGPAYSHLDGEPLCPVPTSNGSEPATPVDHTGTPIPTPNPAATDVNAAAWPRTLDALATAGTAAGRNAADWWLQHPLGGHSIGETRTTAERILAGLTDGDPEILDTLPACDRSGQRAEGPAEADLYRDAAPADAPRWHDLDAEHLDEATETYRAAYDTAAQHRIEAYCRDLLAEP